jgi:lysophospholipase L1-like esterase
MMQTQQASSVGARLTQIGKAILAAFATVLLSGARPLAASQPEPVCRDARGSAAPRVACVGDSNTQSDWQIKRPDGFPADAGWCELLSETVTSVNCGWGGATASPNASDAPNFFQGAGQLAAALSDPPADLVIIALGTNDVRFSIRDPDYLLLPDPTPAAFAEQIESLVATARSHGAQVLVATSPYYEQPTADHGPIPDGFNDRLRELNAELSRRLPETMLIDFTSGFGPADFLDDGRHLNAAGMRKRAQAALAGIERLHPKQSIRWLWLGLALFGLLAWVAARRAKR